MLPRIKHSLQNPMIRKWMHQFKLFVIILMMVPAAFANQPLQLEIEMKNALQDGDRYYFDLYLRQAGAAPVYLAFADFAFDVQPRQAQLQLHYEAGSARLFNAIGQPVDYSPFFDVKMLQNAGQPVGMINIDAPLNINAQNYMLRLARIDAQSSMHRLGRFFIANYQGQLNDFDMELRMMGSGNLAKVFAMVPEQGLQSYPVGLLYKKPQYGEQQALRSMAIDRSVGGVKVAWSSAFEQSMFKYQVLRSSDRQQWVVVQEIMANNNNQALQQYHIIDEQARARNARQQAPVYYRIMAVNNQGVAVESPDKIMALQQDISFRVYPNPARDVVNLRFNEEAEEVRLRVYDAAGRMVINQWADGMAQQQMDVGQLAAGMYFIQAESGNRHHSERLIVLK